MVNDLFDLSLWTGIVLFIYTNLGILYRFFGKLGLFCFNVIFSIISNIVILNKLKAFEMYFLLYFSVIKFKENNVDKKIISDV